MLRIAMLRMEETHLTAEAISRVPSIEICNDTHLLGDVLHNKLESYDSAEQLAALDVIEKTVRDQGQHKQRYQQKESSGLLSNCEHTMLLPTVPCTEVLPAALKTALGLAVNVLKVLYPRIHYKEANADRLRTLTPQAQ
mmetsp:Transcript_49763/g.96125  ORF Transcript_49763/g.96125 Transcript_49763/m.96125 type:complete len:139 (+) Transcript_49763:660-1076(+)